MKKFVAMLLALCLLCGMASAFAESTTTALGVVNTQYGDMQGVSGETYSNVTIFKGVPYATPPVGDLRWTAPVDPQPWEGVRTFDTYAPAAMQPVYVDMIMSPDSQWGEFYPYGAPDQSEDCLYLNIATSAKTGDEKMPVLVWFHGGGYSHGYSYEEEFNNEELANKGIIVVTVGMRLNAFGLLSLPQLSAESSYGGSGNYTIMDCCKALEWVYENIAAFGGDPERITIGGQSGGNSKVTATLTSPLSEGMIYGCYNMSSLNPYATYISQEEAEQRGLEFIAQLGYDENSTLEELRAIPAEDIIEAMGDSNSLPIYSVCIDGYSITTSPIDYYFTPGNLDNMNMMYGNVFGESGSYEAATAEELFAMLRETYGDELVDKYDLENTMPITDTNVALYNYELKTREALNRSRLFAAVAERQNDNLDIYGFTFGRVTPGAEVGWHSAELWYFFDSIRDVEWQTVNRPWQVWDYITADAASTYWANYIATGNPNGNGLPLWPDCSGENNYALQFIDYDSSTWDDLTTFDLMTMEYYATNYGLDFEALDLAQ